MQLAPWGFPKKLAPGLGLVVKGAWREAKKGRAHPQPQPLPPPAMWHTEHLVVGDAQE